MTASNPKCPVCGGCDEFYPSAVMFRGATIKTKGCHCLHCGYELDHDGSLLSPPRERRLWVGVAA